MSFRSAMLLFRVRSRHHLTAGPSPIWHLEFSAMADDNEVVDSSGREYETGNQKQIAPERRHDNCRRRDDHRRFRNGRRVGMEGRRMGRGVDSGFGFLLRKNLKTPMKIGPDVLTLF